MARCDYANARVHGGLARLLGARGLTALATAPRDERARLLAAAGYRESGAPIGDDWSRIDAFLEGAAQRAVWRGFLALEDAAALKALLRGLAAGDAPERIVARSTPTPALPAALLAELAAAGGIDGAVARLLSLGSPFAACLAAALPGFRAHPLLVQLEIPIDRAALAQALAAARGPREDARILRRFVAASADLINAATLLKTAGGAAAAELFLEGGARLDRARFARLAELTASALREALAGWGRASFGEGAAAELAIPWRADALLRRALVRLVRREARARPLSIAVPMAFALTRSAEARRVRLLLCAEELGLPLEQVPELVEAR